MRKKTWRDYLNSLRPSYWLQNYPYSSQWDAMLIKAIAEHRFQDIKRYTAKVGWLTVWVHNCPYACFTPYNPELGIRPRRSTIAMALRLLHEDAFQRMEGHK